MLYITALLLQSCQNTLQVGRREGGYPGLFFLSMKEKEPVREHAQGMVCVGTHAEARGVCLLILKYHNLLLTCTPRLLITPKYKCSQVLIQLSSETRNSSRL